MSLQCKWLEDPNVLLSQVSVPQPAVMEERPGEGGILQEGLSVEPAKPRLGPEVTLVCSKVLGASQDVQECNLWTQRALECRKWLQVSLIHQLNQIREKSSVVVQFCRMQAVPEEVCHVSLYSFQLHPISSGNCCWSHCATLSSLQYMLKPCLQESVGLHMSSSSVLTQVSALSSAQL